MRLPEAGHVHVGRCEHVAFDTPRPGRRTRSASRAERAAEAGTVHATRAADKSGHDGRATSYIVATRAGESARLVEVERFSRQLYLRLKLLTREHVRAELERDPEGAALLDERQMDGLFERRETILSHIEAAVEQYGAERVVVFP